MHRGACVVLLEEMLSEQAGAALAVVGLDAGSARVELDPSMVTVDALGAIVVKSATARRSVRFVRGLVVLTDPSATRVQTHAERVDACCHRAGQPTTVSPTDPNPLLTQTPTRLLIAIDGECSWSEHGALDADASRGREIGSSLFVDDPGRDG